jgi:hypothetical protein
MEKLVQLVQEEILAQLDLLDLRDQLDPLE